MSPTPLVRVAFLGPDMHLKVESAHPSGTMKHRAIPPWLEREIKSKRIARGQLVVIRSAGSAALATAWAGSRLGVPVMAVLTPDASEHVVEALTSYGATSRRVPVDEAEAFVTELCRERGAFHFRQEREAGLIDFYRPVAREIVEALGPETTIVVGIGTGLSITGIAREVEAHLTCAVVGVEPAEAPIASGGAWAPHGITGLAPPFPQNLLERERLSRVLPIPTSEARAMAEEVMRREGLAVGPSTGATLAGAVALAREGHRGPFAAIAAST